VVQTEISIHVSITHTAVIELRDALTAEAIFSLVKRLTYVILATSHSRCVLIVEDPLSQELALIRSSSGVVIIRTAGTLQRHDSPFHSSRRPIRPSRFH